MSMNSFHARKPRPAPNKAEKPIPLRKGIRADALLVNLGLAPSRTAAQRLIEAGRITGPAGPVTKPSQEFAPGTLLTVQSWARASATFQEIGNSSFTQKMDE